MFVYEPSEAALSQLENNFSYHPPLVGQAERYNEIRETAKLFATQLLFQCPESRERSVALTHLETAVMFANAAIARNE